MQILDLQELVEIGQSYKGSLRQLKNELYLLHVGRWEY